MSAAARIAAALGARAEEVCRRYLPQGRKQGRYWTAGDIRGARGRSLLVRLAPPGTPGKWTDASTNEHGDLLDLIRIASGGEMQMVAISRALLGAPGLVLFDEPSQGLAPKVVQDVMATVSRLKDAGLAALLVEQNAATALRVSDRAYVMDRGRIVHEGPAGDLLADDDLRTSLLGV